MNLASIDLYKSIVDFQEYNNLISYPLNLEELCKNNNWELSPYSLSNAEFSFISLDGFTVFKNGKYIIFYNKDVIPKTRIRFTIAHEIGHIVLGHHFFDEQYYKNNESEIEKQADIFSGNILLPSVILHKLPFLSNYKNTVRDMFQIGEWCCKYRFDSYKKDLRKLNYTSAFLNSMLSNVKSCFPTQMISDKAKDHRSQIIKSQIIRKILLRFWLTIFT